MDRQRVDLKVELVDPQAAGGQRDRQVLGPIWRTSVSAEKVFCQILVLKFYQKYMWKNITLNFTKELSILNIINYVVFKFCQ
jgi:hypothetical protein